MHIPLRVLALSSNSRERIEAERVTVLTMRVKCFTCASPFQPERPFTAQSAPWYRSNRGFTAPVVIDFSQSRTDLALLSAHDDDPVKRWQVIRTGAPRQLIAGAKALSTWQGTCL
ncbi:MAG: hypothetical protein R3D29_00465 [Nitratireductor sp.]